MIRRRFKDEEYSFIESHIKEQTSPLPELYDINLEINGDGYKLYVQTDKHNTVNVLYATRGSDYITDGNILASMFELIAYEILRARL